VAEPLAESVDDSGAPSARLSDDEARRARVTDDESPSARVGPAGLPGDGFDLRGSRTCAAPRPWSSRRRARARRRRRPRPAPEPAPLRSRAFVTQGLVYRQSRAWGSSEPLRRALVPHRGSIFVRLDAGVAITGPWSSSCAAPGPRPTERRAARRGEPLYIARGTGSSSRCRPRPDGSLSPHARDDIVTSRGRPSVASARSCTGESPHSGLGRPAP